MQIQISATAFFLSILWLRLPVICSIFIATTSPVFLCVNMFVLGWDSFTSCFKASQKQKNILQFFFFHILLQDLALKQIANEANCCDKQMDMLPFTIPPQPTNPAPHITALIKCSFLSGAASSHLFCCCNQSMIVHLHGTFQNTSIKLKRQIGTDLINCKCINGLSGRKQCLVQHIWFQIQQNEWAVRLPAQSEEALETAFLAVRL